MMPPSIIRAELGPGTGLGSPPTFAQAAEQLLLGFLHEPGGLGVADLASVFLQRGERLAGPQVGG